MSKEVQLRGHPAEEANQFIGADRELTVDTDNRELRLHDGLTPGGEKILNRDQNDERYQARSTELDGLLGWEPNEWGIVTRVGSGLYRLRALTVNPDNMVIQNSDGHDGNPFLSIAPEISDDHFWSGSNQFSLPILAEGGLVGDTTGHHFGPSDGLHTGDVIGNVTGDLQGNSFGIHTGGLDTTGGAPLAMDDESIDPAWIAGFGPALAQAGLPIGSIVMWYGSLGDIPSNWRLCDGSGGTPDLRDRFIIAAGVDNSFGESGGATSHLHSLATDPSGAHAHSGSVEETALTEAQMPAHYHGSGICEDHDYNKTMNRTPLPAVPPTANGLDKGGSGGAYEARSSTVGGGEPHGHAFSLAEGGAHTHVGGTGAASNIPPFYALHYIMKVG